MLMILILILIIWGRVLDGDQDPEQEMEAYLQFPLAKRGLFRSLSIPNGCRTGKAR